MFAQLAENQDVPDAIIELTIDFEMRKFVYLTAMTTPQEGYVWKRVKV